MATKHIYDDYEITYIAYTKNGKKYDGSALIIYDEDDKAWYWVSYSEDTYISGFKTKEDAAQNYIDFVNNGDWDEVIFNIDAGLSGIVDPNY